MKSPRYLLDASALLAVMLGEPGQEKVEAVLDHAAIHTVNLAEVAAKLAGTGVPKDEIAASIAELQIAQVEHLSEEQSLASAEIARSGRAGGFSLGDRICLAVAAATESIALTADRRWREVRVPNLRVELIR